MQKWEQSSQLNFSPTWREWFDFKQQRQREEGQVHLGEWQSFSKLVGCHSLFTFFWFFVFGHGQRLLCHLI